MMFYANVLQTVLAPAPVIFLLPASNSRDVMRDFRHGWLTNVWLVLMVILIAATPLLLYGLVTDRASA